MSDALRRACRTFIQSFLGSVLTSGVLSAIETDGVVDYSVLQKVGVSALAAGLIAFLSFMQNALEDSPTVALPALLKAPASEGVDPVPDPPRRRRPLRAD